jgi:hypothetical protein
MNGERRRMHKGYKWESQKQMRLLGRQRRGCMDNIKMDLKEIV